MKTLLTAYQVECNPRLRAKNLKKAIELGWKRVDENEEEDLSGKGRHWYGPDNQWHYLLPNLIKAYKPKPKIKSKIFNIPVSAEMAVQLQTLIKICQKIDAVDPELEIEGKLRAELNKVLKPFPILK